MAHPSAFSLEFYLIERASGQQPKARYFVYGRAMPVDVDGYLSTSPLYPEKRIALHTHAASETWSTSDLIVQTFCVDAQTHAAFVKNLRQGEFPREIAGTNWKYKDFPITPRPPVLQLDVNTARHLRPLPSAESGIGTLASVESFWSSNKKATLLKALDPFPGPAPLSDHDGSKSWDNLLEILAEEELGLRLGRLTKELKRNTGLSFDGAYAGRLGNMECFSFSLSGQPESRSFLTVIHKKKFHDGEFEGVGVKIQITPPSDEAIWAHVVLRNNNDVLVDRLVQLPAGTAESNPVCAEEPISEFEVRLFDQSGNKPLFVEQSHLIRTIHVSMNMVTGKKTFADPLSRNLVGAEMESADMFNPREGVVIGHYKRDPWVPEARTVDCLVKANTAEPDTCRWFDQGLGGQGDALSYIRNVIDHHSVRTAVIVDPFFGEEALVKLLQRLQNRSVSLTVVTSFLGWDPDEELAQGPNPHWETSADDRRHRLHRWCNTNRHIIAPDLTILDLHDGRNQAFHDRYIIRLDVEDQLAVYMLSTSLNKLAGKFPCCVARLDTAAARRVHLYVRALIEGCDIAFQDCDGSPGKDLTASVIWSRQMATDSPVATSDQQAAEQERPAWWFPFWQEFNRWLHNAPQSEGELLLRLAQSRGLFSPDSNWKHSPTDMCNQLTSAWERLPTDLSEQAAVLAGLGEYAARTVTGEALETMVTELLEQHPDKVDLPSVFDQMVQCYVSTAPPHGCQNIAPSMEVLGADKHMTSNRESFSLLKTAETYLTHGYLGSSAGLWGIDFVLRAGLRASPEAAICWIDAQKTFNPHISAAVVSACARLIQTDRPEVATALLRSQRPFVRMLGIAGLISEEIPLRRQDERPRFGEVLLLLAEAGFPPEKQIWIAGLPVGRAQAACFSRRDLPANAPDRVEADRRLEKLLTRMAVILEDSAPEPGDLDDLDAALRHTTRDRFRLAEMARAEDTTKPIAPWNYLYRRCVADLEKLIGRIEPDSKSTSFHFHEFIHYDMVEVAARSFLRLNGAKWANPFRNRIMPHIEDRVRLAARPHLAARDYSTWSNAVGQTAASCLFGLSVCTHAAQDNLRDSLEVSRGKLLAVTCQLYLAAGMEWFDMAGLLDRLAKDAGWTAGQTSDKATDSMIHKAICDTRLMPFFRACLATVPLKVFDHAPKAAFVLLLQHANHDDDRNVARYFYLLDFAIGNSHRSKRDLATEVGNAVDLGLSTFTNLAEPWAEFFTNAWQALQGEETPKQRILASEVTAQTYCGRLLQGAAGD